MSTTEVCTAAFCSAYSHLVLICLETGLIELAELLDTEQVPQYELHQFSSVFKQLL